MYIYVCLLEEFCRMFKVFLFTVTDIPLKYLQYIIHGDENILHLTPPHPMFLISVNNLF